jgi:hypothetical protein
MRGPDDKPAPDEDDDLVALAIDAAPYDDRAESEEERAAVAEARAEPDGFVEASEVSHVLEAWSRPKTG